MQRELIRQPGGPGHTTAEAATWHD